MDHIQARLNKNKKCLSIGNFGILSVVFGASTVFTSLRRGLKYLFKVWYITLVYPNVANMPNVTAGYGRFSDSITFFGNYEYYNMFETL